MENMAVGFRFYPTEEELISFYLQNKLDEKQEDLNQAIARIIPVLDIYNFNPSDLPQLAGEVCREDPEQWFFFIPRQESEIQGGRPSRVTNFGYWKSSGSPGYVYSSNNQCIGIKRTMIFYNGRAPNGRKTDWKINEYKAIQREEASSSSTPANPVLRQEFSLCRVYKTLNHRRSFDRRPIGVPILNDIGNASAPHDFGEDAMAIHHREPLLMEDRRNAIESDTPREDQGIPRSHETGDSSTPVTIDNDINWDWEHLLN